MAERRDDGATRERRPSGRSRDPSAREAEVGFLGRLVRLDDPDAAVRRVRRNAILILLASGVGVGLVTRSPWQVLATVLTGALMLLLFQAMVAFSGRLLSGGGNAPGVLQTGLLALRYVLLGLVLCAMFLLPGVGPIPVLLGLSILVLAILLEAISQLLPGGPGPP